MVVKHSTTHNPNDIVPSADWNADHTGTATPDTHGNEVHSSNFITGPEVPANETDPVFTAWDKDHADLSNVTTDQHHAKQHAVDSSADHTSTITENNLMDADANGLPDDSGLSVTNVSDAVSKKHDRQHALNSAADHTGSITDAQHGVRTTANAHAHSHLSGVTSDQHHAQSHNAASHSDITSTGANIDDAVSKKHTQNTDTALGAQTQNLDMNTHKIVGVVDPTANQEAATKKYVDDNIPSPGTNYWSCSGANFILTHPDDFSYTRVFYIASSGRAQTTKDNEDFIANVNLPNGAVVTGAKVYGSDSTETWTLHRTLLTNPAGGAMASANMNTEDTTITNATIDNSLYGYFFVTSPLEDAEQIYGARITYTL